MSARLTPLREQVLVLTGGSSGIGLATARLAAERGVRGLVLAARDRPALREAGRHVLDAARAAGHDDLRVVAVPCDVAEYGDVDEVARAAVRAFGGFDTWVNNAATSIYGRLDEVTLDDHRRLMDVNFWGVVHGSRVAVGHFRRRAARGASGALVNVGSALSDRAIPLQGMYCATKHAVKAFTEALRMELEEEGVPVSVSLVKPASVDTPFYDHARNYMDVAPKPIPPVYEPEDVARAILSCAERPRRDVQVGGAAKALAASTAAPRLTDRVMEARLFDAQRDPEGRADGRSAGNLWEPADPATERGHQGGRAVRARPLRHLAAIVAAGVGVALVASARPAGERARE